MIVDIVGDFKITDRGYFRMFERIAVDEIESKVLDNQFFGDPGVFFRIDFYIRVDTSAVIYFSAGFCRVFGNQGVGHLAYTAVRIPVGVIQSLNTSSTGDVVFPRRDL